MKLEKLIDVAQKALEMWGNREVYIDLDDGSGCYLGAEELLGDTSDEDDVMIVITTYGTQPVLQLVE